MVVGLVRLPDRVTVWWGCQQRLWLQYRRILSKPHISFFNKVDVAGHVDGTSTFLKNEVWGLEKMRRYVAGRCLFGTERTIYHRLRITRIRGCSEMDTH